MSQPFPPNPYLSGNFAPILMECDAPDLPILGALPKELRGTLYRNGPNPQYAPRDDRYHWFLGDGMIHAFRIEAGRVAYRNRWVRTTKFQRERAAGRALYGSWGNPATTDPSVAGTDSGGVANTNIVAHASDPVGIAEFGEFQDAIIDKQITTSQEALERAEADILQFGHAVYDVKVSTLIAGCQIGQTITLNSAKFGILNYALVIKRIETVVKAPGDNALGIDTTLEYQIEAIGSDNVTFVDIMATLLQQQNSNIEIADNTVLDAFVTLSESIATADTLTVTGEARPYTWG